MGSLSLAGNTAAADAADATADTVAVSNEYHFVTRCRLQASAEEVADVLRDPRELTRWWPSVYLDVQMLDDGDIQGVGRVVDLWTKGLVALHAPLAIHDHSQ